MSAAAHSPKGVTTTVTPSSSYVGRFAPSPTGPLHFGSLIAALGSFLSTRQAGGRWLLRMEDIDPPREVPGAADAILRSLETHGLEWNGTVLYQSRRTQAYEEALERLQEAGLLYPCNCTRSEIAAKGEYGPFGPIYPGTCRNGARKGRKRHALRVLTHDRPITFEDRLQGPQTQCLQTSVGDFVVRRADGLYAYQLAVVVDDAAQGVTDIVRGADLLDSTARQIHLQQILGTPTPRYLHLPIAVNAQGEKLSKQTHAAPLDNLRPGENLWDALHFLRQNPPKSLRSAPAFEVIEWATDAWRPDRVPQRNALQTLR